jgi:hypothetical protein
MSRQLVRSVNSDIRRIQAQVHWWLVLVLVHSELGSKKGGRAPTPTTDHDAISAHHDATSHMPHMPMFITPPPQIGLGLCDLLWFIFVLAMAFSALKKAVKKN